MSQWKLDQVSATYAPSNNWFDRHFKIAYLRLYHENSRFVSLPVFWIHVPFLKMYVVLQKF
jgi:hypothetical protein